MQWKGLSLRPSNADQGWLEVDHRFDENHPSTNGHFAGNPIIPGAVLLDTLLRAFRLHHGSSMARIDIMHAKFLRPVRPGDTVLLRWLPGPDGSAKFECRVGMDGEIAMTGALQMVTGP
jgi:3-hydroxymyristoyl/3-hydroxydecanoyl-(acyl carrier protein) dehydratase